MIRQLLHGMQINTTILFNLSPIIK